jgi:hypothetical protein
VIFGDAFTAGKFDLCRQLLKDNDLLAPYAKEQLLDCIKQKENSEAIMGAVGG